MATKYFCDVCNGAMVDAELQRIKFRAGRASIEIMTAIDGTWNGGHICWTCIRGLIHQWGGTGRER